MASRRADQGCRRASCTCAGAFEHYATPSARPLSSNDGDPRSRPPYRIVSRISVLARRRWLASWSMSLPGDNYRRGRVGVTRGGGAHGAYKCATNGGRGSGDECPAATSWRAAPSEWILSGGRRPTFGRRASSRSRSRRSLLALLFGGGVLFKGLLGESGLARLLGRVRVGARAASRATYWRTGRRADRRATRPQRGSSRLPIAGGWRAANSWCPQVRHGWRSRTDRSADAPIPAVWDGVVFFDEDRRGGRRDPWRSG